MRKSGRGGGVSIYSHVNFDLVSVTHEEDTCNNNFLIVNFTQHNFKVGGIYRQPNNAQDPNGSNFLSKLDKLLCLNSKMFVFGDMNINLFNQSELSLNYQSTYGLNGYILLNSLSKTYPTRINQSSSSSSCIDHILTDIHFSSLSFRYDFFLFDLIGDHKSIQLIVHSTTPTNSRVKRAPQTVMLTNHSAIIRRKLLESLNPSCFEDFIEQVKQIIAENTYTRKLGSIYKPYVTADVLNLITVRNNFLRLHKKYPDASYPLAQYKAYRNKVTNLLKVEKKKYYESYFQQNINDGRKTWQQLKAILYNKA